MNFPQIEKDYIRQKVCPDFDWTRFEQPTLPTLLKKPVAQCRVALVTTSGAYLRDAQRPFDAKNPLGDDSFRCIPNDTPIAEIALAHPGYNTRRALQDLDCVFPLVLLNHFAQQGKIGSPAPRHFSFMGYIPHTEKLLTKIAPLMGAELQRDQVDLVVLVPS